LKQFLRCPLVCRMFQSARYFPPYRAGPAQRFATSTRPCVVGWPCDDFPFVSGGLTLGAQPVAWLSYRPAARLLKVGLHFGGPVVCLRRRHGAMMRGGVRRRRCPRCLAWVSSLVGELPRGRRLVRHVWNQYAVGSVIGWGVGWVGIRSNQGSFRAWAGIPPPSQLAPGVDCIRWCPSQLRAIVGP